MLKSILAALALGIVAKAAFAQTETPPRGIVIITEGTVRKAPDFATLHAGVVTTGKTAEEALAANRPAMSRIPDIARRFGVSAADIKTSGFSLTPKYRQPTTPGPQSASVARVIESYEARTSLQITVRNLSSAGPLVDEFVRSGSNMISNVSFGLSDLDTVKDEARQKAAQTAKARAKLYADALGVELGEIVSVVDEASYSALDGAADLPSRRAPGGQQLAVSVIEPGEISVSSSLKTIWQVVRK